MGFLFSLLGLGSVKEKAGFILVIALLVGGAGGFGWLWLKYNGERTERLKLAADVTKVMGERDLAVTAAKVSQETIRQLEEDKERSERSMKNLLDLQTKDAARINDLKSVINVQANNPLNKVDLSPVLQVTVDAIQNARAQRAAELSGDQK
jgi:hypothetical protein